MYSGSRLALALPVCLSLLSVSGCSRSSDGTVIIPKPLDSRRFWQDDEAKRAAVERAQSANYPQTSQEIRFVDPQAGSGSARRSSRPRMAGQPQSGNVSPLACRNQTGSNGRVRYVCD
ncbi:hypothetical protein [Aminobacter sp. HY435]|uniref:hypothetical protein n=1 Tax=Aminobacter sp. HY435 TaxID=2970917 RepID=UPI0022B9518C|nr:hypothetical protein [Aminobacter sp. HY435]